MSYTGQSPCAEHCPTCSKYSGHRSCSNDTHNITQYSFLVIFGTGFLPNRMENAENSAKCGSGPYVPCGCHCNGYHESQNSSAALRGHILCSVSPKYIINMGTVDQNQFSPISLICVQSNTMSASQIFNKSF